MLDLDNVTLIHVLEIDSSDVFRIATYNLLAPDKVSDRVIIPSCKLTLRGRRQHLRVFNIVPVDMMNYTPYIIHIVGNYYVFVDKSRACLTTVKLKWR